MQPRKPTRTELLAARDRTVADLIGPGLKVLFCGINPGLYSGAVGHHFARPGNRFWPALQAGGFTPRVLSPFEERELLALGYGITNLVAGARVLERKVRRYRPRIVAIVGITAYRTAFGHPRAQLGAQSELLAGSRLWVLPNPSGLNAHHQAADLALLFGDLHHAAEAP